MTDWPRVDIIIITYDRVDEFRQTVAALEKYLDYAPDKLRILVADDATPDPDYHKRLENAVLTYWSCTGVPTYAFVPADKNVGWGANANRALRFSNAPYVLQLEDDRVLREPFDLYSAIALMETKPEIGMLRVGGTAGDHYVYHQMEADISAFLPTYREGMALPGKCSYFLFDIGSPTLWLYSNTPHLKRNTFHSLFYGYYPEGQKLGATEEQFCHCVVDTMREHPYYPVIAVQPDWVVPRFDHIGKSYQHTELDIERKSA